MTTDKKNLIVALKPLKTGDADGNSSEVTSSSASALPPAGYVIYLGESESIADWIDLQVLITGENRWSLDQEVLNRLKERGTAIFKTQEQAENALSALEKSLQR